MRKMVKYWTFPNTLLAVAFWESAEKQAICANFENLETGNVKVDPATIAA